MLAIAQYNSVYNYIFMEDPEVYDHKLVSCCMHAHLTVHCVVTFTYDGSLACSFIHVLNVYNYVCIHINCMHGPVLTMGHRVGVHTSSFSTNSCMYVVHC